MKKITVITASDSERLALGVRYLSDALKNAGYEVLTLHKEPDVKSYRTVSRRKIYLGVLGESRFLQEMEDADLLLYHTGAPEGEGYYIADCAGGLTVIAGGGRTGALYGALKLSELIGRLGRLPDETFLSDRPVFRLRGPVVGLQKTKVEPPRRTYEYPITPDRFPWFYDRQLWTKFLDMLLMERSNVLYLWSGHPFSSLIELEDYPEALEVTKDELEANRDLFSWLTAECAKRGIRIILKFYNIHIPYPFALAHGLNPKQSEIHPLAADYTRKAIAEFIAVYPNIGLMVCLGEALRGNENKTAWFRDTILPGVLDGVRRAGKKELPPIILRGHDCDPQSAVTEGRKVYKNIDTMWKYNGESLTTFLPRGKWQQIHREFSALSDIHIVNVHILANLEPFRFGAVSFIRKCMQAAKYRLNADGLHLYPLFYWDWPYSPDKKEKKPLQPDRDWLWFKAWFRYAWNPDRDPDMEILYWRGELAAHFGCREPIAGEILACFEAFGECAPRLLGRIGITEGNRQTFSLGMTLGQLADPARFRPNYELYASAAREGESLDEYVTREITDGVHIGETPVEMMETVERCARKASELKDYLPLVTGRKEEFRDWCSDADALSMLVKFYCAKIRAALRVSEYRQTMSRDWKGNYYLLDDAVKFLEESLKWYRKLADLTEQTYRYANSMQTGQRKIPFPDGERYCRWSQCLPEYEEEFLKFRERAEALKSGRNAPEPEGKRRQDGEFLLWLCG